jgi:hypothetical protein
MEGVFAPRLIPKIHHGFSTAVARGFDPPPQQVCISYRDGKQFVAIKAKSRIISLWFPNLKTPSAFVYLF